MEMPERPQLAEKPKSSGLSVVGAGCLGMGLVLGLAVLVMAALGGGTAIGLILFGVISFSLIAVHYAVWGWWLGPRLRAQAEREAAADETLVN